MIRMATGADVEPVCAIYNHYVTDTIVTFEEQPVARCDMQSRMAAVLDKLPWLVLERDGEVAGTLTPRRGNRAPATGLPWRVRSILRPRTSAADSVRRCMQACSITCVRGIFIA